MSIPGAAGTLSDEVRGVLVTYGRLLVPVADLDDDDDLFRWGLTSHANVAVMLALEDAFDVEFPEHMLRRSTFESISSICGAISALKANEDGS